MGVCRAWRHANEILVGRSAAARHGQLQELHGRRHRTAAQARQPETKSIRTLRYGWRRQSMDGGLLAQELSGCPAERRAMGRERLRLARHSIGLLEKRCALRPTRKPR